MKTQEHAGMKGIYHFQHIRSGVVIQQWDEMNLIPTEQLNSILNVGFVAAAQHAAWYMGLGSGNYTADDSDTGANIAGRVTEITAYTGNRPAISFASAVAGATTSSGSPSQFTFNGTVATITNAFIVSAATGNGGVIASSLKLSAARTGFVSGDILLVGFTMTMASL